MVSLWIGALLIGVTLGLLGSGGSALTVPVLVYVVGHDAKLAIAESMAIVGLIALVASVSYARDRQIDWHSVAFFGLASMLGTFFGAWLGGLAAGAIQLVVFGAVLLLAAYSMLRDAPDSQSSDPSRSPAKTQLSRLFTALQGVGVGVVTGFVGVGGGFLIVPALVVMGGLTMRRAIGTSLVIIALNAAVGFAKYDHRLAALGMEIDKQLILLFVALGVAGSLLGKRVGARMNPYVLRRAFALFLIVLGGLVMVSEGRKLALAAAEPAHVEQSVPQAYAVRLESSYVLSK